MVRVIFIRYLKYEEDRQYIMDFGWVKKGEWWDRGGIVLLVGRRWGGEL